MINKNFVAAAIVLAILFGAAFQCGKEDVETDSTSTKKTTDSGDSTKKNNPGSGKLTEAIVKGIITENEESLLGTTGPLSIDIEFESIKFGNPETPSQQDKINGIRSDVYYPVRVKYTIIQHWDSSDRKIERYEDYKFYINSYGEWSQTNTRAV